MAWRIGPAQADAGVAVLRSGAPADTNETLVMTTTMRHDNFGPVLMTISPFVKRR
jgi:hypothetical protein